VTGQGLDDLRHKLGYSVADMCWIFGMPANKWTTYVRKDGAQPVRDESVEILARLLDAHPAASPIPPMPTIEAIFEKLAKTLGPTATYRRLAVLFGRHGSGGSRWISAGGRTPPLLRHIAHATDWMMRNDATGGSDAVREWEDTVRAVANARGIKDDVFVTGKWET
jgi:hypothetical protein